MDIRVKLSTRFSPLLKQGLHFRRRFEQAKASGGPDHMEWYPYDCFSNLFFIQHLLNEAGLSIDEMVGTQRILDLGAADGALSFFFESLGYKVHACDFSGTNLNRMNGLRALAIRLGSQTTIQDIDIDERFSLDGNYGLALFLGTLYHLKNPFYTLEELRKHCRFCILSTRVARLSPDRTVSLENLPVCYLLDPEECNSDATNYWIFSPMGLTRLVNRTGWNICSSVTSGTRKSDPSTRAGDERMFLLLSN